MGFNSGLKGLKEIYPGCFYGPSWAEVEEVKRRILQTSVKKKDATVTVCIL